MKKYSTKKYRNKRRNVKKYKKSQKNGKTRKYKVSKNINRQYSLRKGKGIRRHMSGGISFYDFHTESFAFKLDLDKLKDYINNKYFGDRNDDTTTRSNFTKLKRVAFGKVAITNTSLGFYFRKDNRYEQILVFACYRGETLICYVIARCISDYPCQRTFDYTPDGYHAKPTDGMEEKILFVNCRNVKKLDFGHLTTDKKSDRYKAFEKFVKTEARNKGIPADNLKEQIVTPDGGYHLFEFGTLNTELYRSSGDLGDTYRVIILPLGKDDVEVTPSGKGFPNDEVFPGDEALTGYQRLVKFFDNQAQPIHKGDESYATQDIEFRKASTGNGADGAIAGLSFLPTM